MKNNEEIEYNENTVFNMGISTLMRIDSILKEIVNLDLKDIKTNEQTSFSKSRLQSVKLRLVKQLYINSVPLLSEKKVEGEEDLWEKLSKLNLITKKNKKKRWNEKDKEYIEVSSMVYDKELEQKLNDIIIQLQTQLQKKGVFMPTRDDSRLALSKME